MFIDALWAHQPGQYFFLATKSATGSFKEHVFKRGEWNKLRKFIKANDDKDVYFCPHGFTKPTRKKSFAVMPNMLWSDMDEVDPRQCKPKPTIAIESSPGRYVGLWLIDKPATESVNRRLTYHIGADKGGWDVTQVLRVPGTLNYKYQSTPKVRLLWDDGPTYKLKKIESMLPDEEDEPDEDAASLLQEWEGELDRWCVRALTTDTPAKGKRSDMLWKIGNHLRDKGLKSGEIFALLKSSPWNKWRDKSNETEQLQREIKKVLASKLKRSVAEDDDDDRTDHVFLGQAMSDVEEENVDWLWYPYLALGEVTIVEGMPDMGKSYVCQMIAKHIVDGEKLPSLKKMPAQQGKVAYFDVENDAARVTKKRLVWNDCANLKDFYAEEEPFMIDDPRLMKRVHAALEKKRPKLVVFDTLNFYVGKGDTGKANEMAQAIQKFKTIARRYDCAVILIRHWTKGSKGDDLILKGQGNMAIIGTARITVGLAKNPEDQDGKVMFVIKNNLADEGCKRKSLTFSISALPDKMNEYNRSRFSWDGYIDKSGGQIMAETKSDGERVNVTAAAVEFLQEVFEDEDSVDKSKLDRMAEGRGITVQALARAKDKVTGMKIKARRVGKAGAQGRWVWCLV